MSQFIEWAEWFTLSFSVSVNIQLTNLSFHFSLFLYLFQNAHRFSAFPFKIELHLKYSLLHHFNFYIIVFFIIGVVVLTNRLRFRNSALQFEIIYIFILFFFFLVRLWTFWKLINFNTFNSFLFFKVGSITRIWFNLLQILHQLNIFSLDLLIFYLLLRKLFIQVVLLNELIICFN